MEGPPYLRHSLDLLQVLNLLLLLPMVPLPNARLVEARPCLRHGALLTARNWELRHGLLMSNLD